MLGEEPVRQPAAVDRLDAAQERVDGLSSYRYNMTMTASTTANDDRIDGYGVGSVNATTRRQVVNLSVDGERGRTYIDDRTAITYCSGVPGGLWGQRELSTEPDWTTLTPLGRQLDLLSTGDIYHNGTETIDGREVVHLSGQPSRRALSQHEVGSGSVSMFGSPNVDSVTVDLWLDAETDRPVRSEIQVVSSSDDETATATLSTRYRDYGESVRVSIPDEVQDPFYSDGCPGSEERGGF